MTKIKRAPKRSPKRQTLVSKAKVKRRGWSVTEKFTLMAPVAPQSMYILSLLAELSRFGARAARFDDTLDSVILVGGTAMLAGIVQSDGGDRRARRAARKVARRMQKDYPGWKSPV